MALGFGVVVPLPVCAAKDRLLENERGPHCQEEADQPASILGDFEDHGRDPDDGKEHAHPGGPKCASEGDGNDPVGHYPDIVRLPDGANV
jgi:hypothetical protein